MSAQHQPEPALQPKLLEPSIDLSAFLLASRLTALVPLVIGCLVFIGGWVLGSRSLLSVLPNAATMKANTALGLVLAAGALLLEGRRSSLFRRRMAQLCTTLLMLIGTLTLVEYIAGIDLGIDQILLRDWTSTDLMLPGRPSVTTAVCFFLLGGALFLRNRPRTLLLSQCLALFVATLSAASLVGYFYGIRNFIGILFYTGIAVHTSAAILMLCSSALLSAPDQGLMRIVSSASMGGRMARRLLPAAVLIPLTIGWLRWRGELAGYYGTAFGLALTTTGNIAALVFLIWLQGKRLNRTDLERLRASQELHERDKLLAIEQAEDRFRLSFEEAPVGMALLSGDGLWFRVNRTLCEMTGYSERELITLNHGITHPDDMSETQQLVKSMTAGDISYCRQEKRYMHKNGMLLHVLLHVSALSKDATGKARGFVAHMVDITKLKRAEEALRVSEERFRVALKSSPVVVFNQDHELRYTWINSPVLAWAGQDYLGHTDAEILGEEEGGNLMAVKQGVLQNGIGTRAETTVTYQGETHSYDLTVDPLRDDKGAVVGITCAAVDVTPLKQAASELEYLNKLKNEFLGMAAHDLRNPIGGILILAEVLCDEVATVLTEEQLQNLSGIRRSSKFMLQLIDQLLDISSIEAGRLHLDRRGSDLNKLLERNVSLNAKLARQKQIRVGLQIEGALPRLSLDEGRIEQVLNNLISNAVKFSQPATAVEVRAAAHDGGVLISVRDKGPGIPEAEQAKLFQPFGRTSVHSTAGERSTGLGLAISRKIVEEHGGRIWLESYVGLGSVFLFTLPA